MEVFFNNSLLFGEDILNTLHIHAGPLLDYFMVGVTTLGNQIFFMIVLPLLYWCYDKKTAIQIATVFLLSSIINTAAKSYFNNPRPDPDKLLPAIRDLYLQYRPSNPGFPSGHTQGSLSFWGAAAYYKRNRNLAVLAACMMILIPYSRIYLGVHFLGDVAGGYVLGAASLLIFIPLVAVSEKHARRVNTLLLLAAINILPWIFYYIMPEPFMLKTMAITAALFSGLLIEEGRFDFTVKSSITMQGIKIVIGLGGLMLIRFGFKLLPHYPFEDFVRYWFMGFWVTFFAPLVFSRIPGLKVNS